MSIDFETGEPSPSDLAAIVAEWPRIEFDLAELDAEIREICAADCGGPTELDRRRVRRAAARTTRAAATLASPTAGRHACDLWRCTEVAMSDCRYGCKVMRCDECGAEQVEHRAAYGCPTGRAALGLRPAA